MKTLILIIAMMLLSINLYSAPPDECLKYYFHPDSTFTNPDSVMVDSCDGSPTYGVYFAKKFFGLVMQYNIIPRTYLAPADTIIEYSINNIESQYTDAINEFSQLQTNYGNFKFREHVPNMPDTTLAYKRSLLLIFENYVPITEVENVLRNLSSVNTAGFASWFIFISDVYESESQNQFLIYPNPVSDFLMIRGLDESQVQSISIFNTFGQKLYEGDLKEQIDVSSLTPGVYFIRIGDKVEKFVKM